MSYSKYDLCCVMQRRAVNWYGTSIVLYCITSHISVVKSNEDETSNKEERETKIEDRYRCQPLPVMHCGIMTSLPLNWAFSLVVGCNSPAERLFPVTCIALTCWFKLP